MAAISAKYVESNIQKTPFPSQKLSKILSLSLLIPGIVLLGTGLIDLSSITCVNIAFIGGTLMTISIIGLLCIYNSQKQYIKPPKNKLRESITSPILNQVQPGKREVRPKLQPQFLRRIQPEFVNEVAKLFSPTVEKPDFMIYKDADRVMFRLVIKKTDTLPSIENKPLTVIAPLSHLFESINWSKVDWFEDTEKQMTSLKNYKTDSGYRSYNTFLRTSGEPFFWDPHKLGRLDFERNAANYMKVFSEIIEVASSLTLIKNLSDHSVPKKLFRVTNLPQDYIQETHQIGSIIYDKAFWSTSTCINECFSAGDGQPIYYAITICQDCAKVPQVKDSAYNREDEYLYQPYSQFKVLRIEYVHEIRSLVWHGEQLKGRSILPKETPPLHMSAYLVDIEEV